jgi:predicted  nucleic acid-binding Zn-ribbon protein
MRQDLEHELGAKIDRTTKECQKFQSLYYKSKLEIENIRLAGEHETSRLNRVITELKCIHTEEISTWQNQISTLQSSLDDVSQTERLRHLQREKADIELRANSLLSEIEELRALQEKQYIDFEQKERSFKRQLTDQIAEAQIQFSEKEALRSKVISQLQ